MIELIDMKNAITPYEYSTELQKNCLPQMMPVSVCGQ
jgi:hypothetical protein